jgi:hypothetical protein
MSDNPKSQGKDEDLSYQSASEEDSWRGKISRVTTKIQQPTQRQQGRPVESTRTLGSPRRMMQHNNEEERRRLPSPKTFQQQLQEGK